MLAWDEQNDQVVVRRAGRYECSCGEFHGGSAPGFSDYVALEIARKVGHLPLGTFDRDLAKFDGAVRKHTKISTACTICCPNVTWVPLSVHSQPSSER